MKGEGCMPKNHVSNKEDKEINEIISTFKQAGIIFERKKKEPKNGQYSGIIGNSKEVLKLDI